MRLTPNLAFGGQCEAAFKFYERCFGAKIDFMLTYGKSPMAEQVPPRWREKIFHATLTVGENVLMGADPVPEQYEQPKGFVVLPRRWVVERTLSWLHQHRRLRIRSERQAEIHEAFLSLACS